ncbi:MAG: hypothetical protein GQ532_03440 [Methylomarinum sp.]|nr:hypothetical protein [Methylomarinum sp.]
MSIITDLARDLRNYPDDHVRLSIIDFKEPGTVINPGETCSFKIKIENNGFLDMQNVKLHVNGKRSYNQLSQSDVLGNPINFFDHLTTAAMNISAGHSITTRTFYMKAIKATSSTVLIEAHIGDWDAGMASLLRIHAGHDYGAVVHYNRDIVVNT